MIEPFGDVEAMVQGHRDLIQWFLQLLANVIDEGIWGSKNKKFLPHKLGLLQL